MTHFFKSLCLLHYSQLGLLHFQVCNLLSLFYPPFFCPPQKPTQSSSASFCWSLSHTFSVFAVLFEMFSSPAIFLCLPCSLSVHLSLAPLRAVSIFQTQRVFSRSCARVSLESQAVDGFGGEDPSSLWTHHGTDRVKEGQRHTCTYTNANTRSCSFQISLKEIEFDKERGVVVVPLFLCLVQIAICSSQVLTM